MSKKTPKKSAAPKTAATKLRWSLGVYRSATTGELIAVYCRKDGVVSPSYAKTVASKKALFHMIYFGMTYVAARKLLFAEAAKAGVKEKKIVKASAKEARQAA